MKQSIYSSLSQTKLIVLILLTSAVQGCGSADPTTAASTACAGSSIIGSFSRTSGGADTLKFNSDCTGTSSSCASTFTFPNVTATSGTVLVNVTSSSGAGGCLPLGANSCAYSISGNTMAYNCGGGVLTYNRL